MIHKNRYFNRSKLSEAKFRQIVKHFALDLTATECAALSGISVRSVNSIYLRMRVRMAQWCSQRSPLCGELEADESYFGPRRVRVYSVAVAALPGGRGDGQPITSLIDLESKHASCLFVCNRRHAGPRVARVPGRLVQGTRHADQ